MFCIKDWTLDVFSEVNEPSHLKTERVDFNVTLRYGSCKYGERSRPHGRHADCWAKTWPLRHIWKGKMQKCSLSVGGVRLWRSGRKWGRQENLYEWIRTLTIVVSIVFYSILYLRKLYLSDKKSQILSFSIKNFPWISDIDLRHLWSLVSRGVQWKDELKKNVPHHQLCFKFVFMFFLAPWRVKKCSRNKWSETFRFVQYLKL